MKSNLLRFFTLITTLCVAACQSQSNSLSFSTPLPSATFNTQNQTAVVNVITQDHRSSREIANFVSKGNTRRLNANPDVTLLFQQAMQQDLNAKGFPVVQGAGNVNVLVNIKKFFADVQEGNLRYRVDANVNVEVVIQGARGQFNKNFATARSYEGVFGANNAEIQKVLGEAYQDAVRTIYNDNEISNAIHQLK